jgi:hypothetical protein
VLRQVQRLEDELDALVPDQPDGGNERVAAQARERVEHAKNLAGAPTTWKTLWATLRNWWTGNAVETAWNDLQTAREKLMLIEPSDQVTAQIPGLQRRLASISSDPAHDPHLA